MLESTLFITLTPIAALFAVHVYDQAKQAWLHRHDHHNHHPAI